MTEGGFTKIIEELAPKNNIYTDEIALQCELEILNDHYENSIKYDEIMKISEKLKNILSEANYIYHMATTAPVSDASNECCSFSAFKNCYKLSSHKLGRQKTFKFTNCRTRKGNFRQF